MKNLQIVFRLNLLDPDADPYIIYGSGFRRANNIRIQLDTVPRIRYTGFTIIMMMNIQVCKIDKSEIILCN